MRTSPTVTEERHAVFQKDAVYQREAGRDNRYAQGVRFVLGRIEVFILDLESRTTIVARLSKSIACPDECFAIPIRRDQRT
ncbi:hypothetical protein Pla52n_16320 [Stieleria varia]|uniref:Uncharacterized protein n=1 Tax=Stieleria varia TaxID=2528005 RepID=A0A5C6B3R7_9BACT|nr:hypothetical protein Pla52n_16320 [Stieleria varia]